LPAGDFESPVSTNSTTPARVDEGAKYTNSKPRGNGRLGNFAPCCILLRDSAEPHPVGPVDLSIFREKRYGDEAHQEDG
jgi:hypothetical protein